MRVTLAIDDDVFLAAKKLAAAEGKSVGEVISSLARIALGPLNPAGRTRNGVPLLPVSLGVPRVSSELVQRLRDELP
jgi:hypothetical protein